jgi:hypothetical protein
MYTMFFISFLTTLALGCYLHPSSAAQLQRAAIGFVSVENRGFGIKWCGGLFYMDLCVLVFQSRVIFMCWCVCHWICYCCCVVMMCDLFVDIAQIYLRTNHSSWPRNSNNRSNDTHQHINITRDWKTSTHKSI